MRKKIILTKKRKEAVNLALSVDEILYERHRRWEKSLHEDIEKWNRQKQVIKVMQHRKGKSGEVFRFNLQIIKEIRTPQGIIVEVV